MSDNETVESVTVDLPEENKDDITAAETIKTTTKQKLESIYNEQFEFIKERSKEMNIDFDKIEFEDEEKHYPKVTQEDLDIFTSVASEMFDKDTMSTYYKECRENIKNYLDMKTIVDSGEADDADIDHFKDLSEGYENSRIVLATIQCNAKDIKRDFDKDKISESIIRHVTLKTIRDFTIDKFKLSDSWLNDAKVDVSKIDRSTDIYNNFREKLYVTPIFYEYIREMSNKVKSDARHCCFGEEFVNTKLEKYVYGLSSYINRLGNKNNINLSDIINKDLKALDFVKAILLYTYYLKDEKVVRKLDLNDETIALFNKKLNPNNYFIADSTTQPFTTLYDIITEIRDLLKNEELIEKLCELSLNNLKKDPIYHKIDKVIVESGSNVSINDYGKYIEKITTLIPEIEGLKIIKWGKYYSYIKKYDTYMTFCKYLECIKDKTREEVDYDTAVFNVIASTSTDIFDIIYGNFICNIDTFISNNFNKDVRETMFQCVMNSLLLQHNFGYKSDIVPNLNNTGDTLYELAKDMFKDQYNFIVGEEKSDDPLLKDVDLITVRRSYIDVTTDILRFILHNLNIVKDNSYQNRCKEIDEYNEQMIKLQKLNRTYHKKSKHGHKRR